MNSLPSFGWQGIHSIRRLSDIWISREVPVKMQNFHAFLLGADREDFFEGLLFQYLVIRHA